MGCSADPTATPSVSPRSPAASAQASVQPSPEESGPAESSSPSPSTAPSAQAGGPAFEFEDILRVDVETLPVRVAPLPSMPLATGWRDGVTDIGEVRLREGDYVSVELGPLRIGDTTWYRVLPAENAQLHASTVIWDTSFDGPTSAEAGWIAAAIGPEANVSLHESTDPQSSLEGLPLLMSGTGDVESGPIEGSDRYFIDWAYASTDGQPAPCTFYVALVTEDRSASVVILDLGHTSVGAYHDGAAEFGPGDGQPVVGDEFVPLVVHVASGCAWSLSVQPVSN
jgi:hypothetical protein